MLTIDFLFAVVVALTAASAAAAIALSAQDRTCRSARRVVAERLAGKYGLSRVWPGSQSTFGAITGYISHWQ